MKKEYEELDELIYLAKNNQEMAKVRLIEKLSPLIKSSIKKYCPIYLHYEDLYQDGIVIILECLELYDEEKANFLAMAKSYLKYHYIETLKYLKNIEKDISKTEEEEDIVNLISSEENIEEEFIFYEEVEFLKKKLEILTLRQRDILLMYYYEKLSHKEIAQKLNISKWTVVNTKRRALEKLKEVYNVD